ncbi:MAG: glycosyltransferase family 2 protein [Flavobacteriaceae bacterium]|jgi:GT2 family glycosyltransferase|nr:glycosyltransferase family 2 protein [Flavobacteriaceae bacterium]MBT5233317.1 glycosyltransferase family 2 protein [Flavobacteriaceae bacterium]
MKVAIVILNWNGLNHLKKFLPSVVKHSDKHNIYVIDNNSSDNSVKYLNKNYPKIKLIINSKNYGYAKGYNLGLKEIKEEVYCLLNNDVQVTEGWLTPIIEEFDNNKSVVIAQPKILDFNEKDKFEHAGAAGGFIDYFGYPYCRGRMFNTVEKDKGQYDQNIDIFWASGACFFIRKEIFELINGFDENFTNHMEEIDLCWRLSNLKPNFKKRFLFKSVVYHLGGGSLNYDNPKKLFYNIRNQRWMLIKNINLFKWLSPTLIIIQSVNLLLAFYYLFTKNLNHFKEVFNAIIQNSISINGSKFNILDKYYDSKPKSSKPKHYTIKSILVQYFFRGRKKFSDLT